jgi:hypothetical protein
MIRHALSFVALTLLAAPAALAQAFEPPPFEALDVQRQMVEQRSFDELEGARRNEITRSIGNPAEASRSALVQMEINREIDRLRLQGALERDADEREDTISAWTLPNRRIAATSVLVIDRPERFRLPPVPRGSYYARVDGRFVRVDAVSEMVVEVIQPLPADPVSDVPLPPRADPAPGVATPGVAAAAPFG